MRILRSALLLALASCALAAQAAVIDFENLAGTGQGDDSAMFYGPSVVSGGFRFDAGSLASAGPAGPSFGLNYTGSIALLEDSPFGTITMTQVGGGAFSLDGIDLANLYTDVLPQGSTVTFTGSLVGGGAVFQSFTLAQGNGLQTFAFTGFSGVTSVSWTQDFPFHQFDNVVVSAAAVPGPLAALPFALIALRRRKRV